MAAYFNQRVLHGLLHDTILPWARAGQLLLTVARPGGPAPEGVTITPQKNAGRQVSRPRAAAQRNLPWRALGLHCRPHPLMLFVLDGEADIRIGHATHRPCGRTASADCEVSVYGLPARSCFIVPPDVAHSDGGTPHWERPGPEKARSRILWLQILATGAIAHMCRTDGLVHTHNTSIFIRDPQISLLMRLFLERAERPDVSTALLNAYLATLLLCLDHSQPASMLPDAVIPETEDGGGRGLAALLTGSGQTEAFERARLYIASHLSDSLSPAQIARQTHVSVAQLNRLFHSRAGLPVMKYVSALRLEEARALLLRTGLSIEEVGEICGYPHRTHFSRVFKERYGLSPLACRRAARQPDAGQHRD